jgi:glycosyltransferase involved in cell wall biosynthesis
MNDAEAQTLRRVAADHGVDGLVLTSHVSEESLRWLYQHCTVFISPSLYEGFGLPIAEAMACGAPVVAANNSAQPEVLGDAGLLFSTGDPIETAGKLARVLNNSELRADLRRRGLVQAQKFSWQNVARKLEAAMEMIRR